MAASSPHAVKSEPGASADPAANGNAAGAGAKAGGKTAAAAAAALANPHRPPVLWLLLQQTTADGEPTPAAQQGHVTCVPLHIDVPLPDFIVRPEVRSRCLPSLPSSSTNAEESRGGECVVRAKRSASAWGVCMCPLCVAVAVAAAR